MAPKPSKKRPVVRVRAETELDRRISALGSTLPTAFKANQLLPDVSKLKILTPDIDKALIQATGVRPLTQSLHRIDGRVARALTDTAAARLTVNHARTIGGLDQLGFAQPLAGISERLMQINQAILGPSRQIQKMLDQWGNIWKGWKPQFEAAIKAMGEMIEAQRQLDERTDVFVKNHGWPVPLRLFGRQYSQIVAMADEGKRKVNATMQTTFKPGTKAHGATKELLLESPVFASRKPLLQQAFKAQKRGEWYLVINALLPLVEGVLIEIAFADGLPTDRVGPRGSVNELKGASNGDPVLVEATAIEAIETMLFSAGAGVTLFSDFERRDYGVPGEPRALNRHAVLHGAARRYGTGQNALKLYLLLVMLAEFEGYHSAAKEREKRKATQTRKAKSSKGRRPPSRLPKPPRLSAEAEALPPRPGALIRARSSGRHQCPGARSCPGRH